MGCESFSARMSQGRAACGLLALEIYQTNTPIVHYSRTGHRALVVGVHSQDALVIQEGYRDGPAR
jgi:hypothetical protein